MKLGLNNNLVTPNVGAVGAGFSLDSISDLEAWYKFDTNITLNGSNVSEWGDSSGNGNDLTQSTASDQPAYNSGDIHFDETNDNMVMDTMLTLTASDGFTVLAVISTDDDNINNQTLFSGADSVGAGADNGRNFFRYDLSLWRFRPESGSASQQTITHDLVDGEKFLLTLIGSNSSGTFNFAIRDNGTAIGNADLPSSTGSDTFKLNVIGDHNQTNQLWDGKISEFVVYSNNLTGADLTNAEDDLMTRHGL